MVRQLFLGASPSQMKKIDLIEKIAVERRAFIVNTLNMNHQALSVASKAYLNPRVIVFIYSLTAACWTALLMLISIFTALNTAQTLKRLIRLFLAINPTPSRGIVSMDRRRIQVVH
jgi:hypothetical protein